MMFAPLFGYLGDRYNRKVILCIGLSIWCFATFAGSFATNFWVFLFFRALVSIIDLIVVICCLFLREICAYFAPSCTAKHLFSVRENM